LVKLFLDTKVQKSKQLYFSVDFGQRFPAIRSLPTRKGWHEIAFAIGVTKANFPQGKPSALRAKAGRSG